MLLQDHSYVDHLPAAQSKTTVLKATQTGLATCIIYKLIIYCVQSLQPIRILPYLSAF